VSQNVIWCHQLSVNSRLNTTQLAWKCNIRYSSVTYICLTWLIRANRKDMPLPLMLWPYGRMEMCRPYAIRRHRMYEMWPIAISDLGICQSGNYLVSVCHMAQWCSHYYFYLFLILLVLCYCYYACLSMSRCQRVWCGRSQYQLVTNHLPMESRQQLSPIATHPVIQLWTINAWCSWPTLWHCCLWPSGELRQQLLCFNKLVLCFNILFS